jgi:hypothetical protein
MADKNQSQTLDFSQYFKENPYTENADNYAKNNSDNSDNNSNNRNSNDNYNLDAIQAPGYNQQLQNSVYGDALRFNSLGAEDANRQLANREWQTSQQANSNYQQKANIDDAQLSRRAEIAKNSAPQSAGTFSSYNDGLTRYDPVLTGSATMPGVKYVPRQDKDVAMFELQNSTQERNKGNDFVRSLAMADANRYQQQRINTQQNNAGLQQTAAQGKNQRDVAAIGATGNILGSLFGSANSGSPNYKFWN